MKKIFFANLMADFPAKGNFDSSWDSFVAPKLLQESFELKGISSSFVNFNTLFLDEIFSKKFIPVLLSQNDDKIKLLESKDSLGGDDLNNYLLAKFIQQYAKTKGLDYFFEKLNKNKLTASNLNLFLLEEYDIFQSGELKVDIGDEQLKTKTANFEVIFKSLLKQFDFSDSLIIFSIPSKFHISSAIPSSKILKELFPSCQILIGGSFVNALPKEFLDELVDKNVIDFYICRNSEQKLYSFLSEFKEGRLENFRGEYSDMKSITINDFVRTKRDDGPVTTLFLSTGCNYGKCKYCDYTTSGNHFAIKNLSVIIAELENLYAQGVRNFILRSDTFVPLYGVRLAKEIIKRKLDIKWNTFFLRVDPLFTKENLRILKQSGFQFEMVFVGMESPIDAALKYINKGYTQEIILKFFQNLRELGIKLGKIAYILDIPCTTPEDVSVLKDFAINSLDITHDITWASLYLPVNSEFAINPEKYGIELLNVDTTSVGFINYNFRTKYDFLGPEKIVLEKYFNFLRLLVRIRFIFPDLDIRFLAQTKIYNESKFKLKFKINSNYQEIHSLFDETGNKKSKSLFMSDNSTRIHYAGFFLYDKFNKLEKNKWYSIGDLVELEGYKSLIEKRILLQDFFWKSLVLLSSNAISDVKIELIQK